MQTLVINTKSTDNAELILELVKTLGESGKILDTDEKEDFLLGMIMNTEKTGIKVSREEILKKLKK